MIDIICTMAPQGLRVVETLPLLFQGEVNAHRFIIQPAAGVSLAGCTIQGRFIRADNRQIDLIGAVNGENAEIALDGACYQIAGRAQLTVYAIQGTQAVAIYAAVGNVFPSMGAQAASTEPALIQPYPVNRMLADQNLRSWWIGGESATVNYYGATVTMDGNEITINGTMTGDNSVGQDTDWEVPTEYYDDYVLDLSRQLKHMDKTDPLLLYLEPHHVYRLSCATISGTMEFDRGSMTGTILPDVAVRLYGIYGRGTLPIGECEAVQDLDLSPFAGLYRVYKHKIRPNVISELERRGIPYDIHGGSLGLRMPGIRDGATATFHDYKIGISLADVTGLGGYKDHSNVEQDTIVF